MGIENVKRWHWVILGLLLGLGLGYSWTAGETQVEGLRSADAREFERLLGVKDPTSGKLLVSDIVIHPEEASFEGPVNVVTFKRLAVDRKGRNGWITMRMVARVPYQPALGGGSPGDKQFNIEKYLTQVASQNTLVKFRYGWWKETRKGMMLGAVAGLVLIGGLWPTLLNTMLGAGLGPRRREPKEKKDRKPLWSYKSTPEPSTAAHRPSVSAADQDRVREVAEAYEKGLQTGGVAMTAEHAEAAAQAEIRKLEAGPLQQAAPMKKPGEDDDIEVKGEYYPVLIHHAKKKPDETPPKKDK